MKNIVLIGMPGAGKSTVGIVLAKTLGMSFIDTDIVIQETEGRLLQNIIDSDGTSEFMKIEEAAVLSVKVSSSVIATGGSVVYSSKAMNHLRKENVVVYLMLNYDEIVGRLSNIQTRGVVLDKGSSLRDIYNERIPLYEKYSDVTIDCNNKNVEVIIKEILDSYHNNIC